MEIKTIIVTQVGKRIDELVFAEYGHLRFLEAILELNIKVIEMNVHLAQGIKLQFPNYQEKEETLEVEASKLW